MIETTLIRQFREISDRFNQAVVSNDTWQIRNCITADWTTIIAPPHTVINYRTTVMAT